MPTPSQAFAVQPGRAVWFLAAAGVLIAATAWAGFSPLLALAGLASDDGQLSAAFVQATLRSQLHFGVVLAGAALLARRMRRPMEQAVATVESLPPMLPTALLTAGLTMGVQQVLFGGIPHVTDAISHLFQAKILAGGRLWADRPECHEFFRQINIYMTHSGRWFAPYPPGHATTLLPFVAAGWSMLFGPVAAGATAGFFTASVRFHYGNRTAWLAGGLFALSPLALLLSSSFMSHVSFLLYAVLTVWMATHGLDLARKPSTRRLYLAGTGLAAGLCFITRPQDAALLALAALLPLALQLRSHGLAYLTSLPWIALGAIAPLAWQGTWNHAIYGSALAVGYGRTQLDVLHPVLLSRLGLSDTFPLGKALQQFVWTLWRYDRALLGCGGALLVALPAFLRKSLDQRDAACAWCIAVVLAFYCFCDYYGFELEARYFSPAIPCTLVLLARGIQRMAHWTGRALALGLLAAMLLQGMTLYWPRHVWPEYAGAYEQASPAVHRAAQAAGLGRALVLLPSEGEWAFRYSSGFIWNDPELRAPIIYGRALHGDSSCLFERFPDRRIYRFVPQATPYTGRFEEIAPEGESPRTDRTTPAA